MPLQEVAALALAVGLVAVVACWATDWCRWQARRRDRLIEVCLVLLGLIQDLQLHRGLSGAILDKRRDFHDDYDANEYKLLRTLEAVSLRYARHHAVFRGDRWLTLLGRWEALRQNWRGLSFETSIFAHSEVITGLIEILTSLAHDNHHLIGPRDSRCITEWPPLIEDLGLLRAMGLHLLGHRPTHEDRLHVDKIAAQLNIGRARLRHITPDDVDRTLLVRTERAFHRVSWLLDGNAERYHPYTFYEEMTLVIDDWFGLLRHRLQEAAPNRSIAHRLVNILRLHVKTG
jgi:hypothetical protein